LRMERLVEDMLAYARPRKMQLVSTDMGNLVAEVVQAFSMAQDAKGREVKVDVQGAFMAAVDHSQIKQVLWNLLSNAAHATEPGDHIEVVARIDGRDLFIEVKDKGKGISSEDQKKIFDPFYSTRELGLGLGLALCKRIIDDHGGNISAEPRAGGGAVFKIMLPKAVTEPPEPIAVLQQH
jgi:two-component system NtrC family sensor kinase